MAGTWICSPLWARWLLGLRASLCRTGAQRCTRETAVWDNAERSDSLSPLLGSYFQALTPAFSLHCIFIARVCSYAPVTPSLTCQSAFIPDPSDLCGLVCHWAVADLVYCPHWSCHSLAGSTSRLDLGPALWFWTCLRIGTLSWTLLLSLDVSCSPCWAAVSLCSSPLLLPASLSCLAPCLPCWAACFCYSLTLAIVTFFNPDLITDIIYLHLDLWVLNLMIRFLEALQIEHPNMCNHV